MIFEQLSAVQIYWLLGVL